MKCNEDDVRELANGCDAVECQLPESWWLGNEKVLCACGSAVQRVYPFAKIQSNGKRELWVRFLHAGYGFCEVRAGEEGRKKR